MNGKVWSEMKKKIEVEVRIELEVNKFRLQMA